MSNPRKRRWMDVLRRTAGAASSKVPTGGGLDDADLWASRDDAARSAEDGARVAERMEATAARGKARADDAHERATLLAAEAEALTTGARRTLEAFDRLRMVALNAGLEGARAPDDQGRALLLVADEIRASVDRGAEMTKELLRAASALSVDAGTLGERVLALRADTSELATDAASAKASAHEATRALDLLEGQLRKATGFDPEVARAVSLAAGHARGLVAALSTIQTSHVGSMALGALRPVLKPVARALGELAVGPEGGRDDEED